MDISYIGLLLAMLLLVFPLMIFSQLKLKLSKQLLISFGRMIGQLALIGLWLQFLLDQEDWRLTLLWVAVMLVNAIMTLRGRLRFQRRILVPVLFAALGTASLVVMPWILFMVVRPDPLFSAKFVIPIYGMVLGNSMNSCALALERFESGLSDNWKAYYTRLSLGATLWEAALPPFRKAMQASLLPQLLTIASMGVVSLPGMMTGQILGGSSAIVAIKYQMMVMAAIFSAVTLADFVAIRLYLVRRFNRYYLPIQELK
ncbi:MAG TPA: ABC transporter permease [Candidatus Cloacimonadota bacterium]|nr:ABC transporter permease [Candidatus Cloacimonadota bacterium]MDD4806446.1 ABC transporter permease [Candidatus Cloacimonadota bacterium]HOA29945.1 ABC transporter permease [Candidatus Cloacimonadota bacterium]